MKTALILLHLAFENLGNLESVLIENNYQIQYVDATTVNYAQLDPLKSDLLVILGGPISVYEEHLYPFLIDETSFIKQRVEKKLPTLGICLGAQFIAKALGARVYAGSQKEIGWNEIQLTAAGNNSFMKQLDQNLTKVLHWHGDTFDLPENAELLASTTLYPHQAFMIDNTILALQFHPEILPHAIENWLVGHTGELQRAQIDINKLRKDTTLYVNQLNRQAKKFWQAWIDVINENSFHGVRYHNVIKQVISQ